MTSSPANVSRLRQRMIDDMRMRQLAPKTQDIYLHIVREFARFLGRSPATATVEDLRRYQLYLVDHGTSAVSLNHAITGLKFFFTITLDRPELMVRMQPVRVPRILPVVLSPDEVRRLIAAAGNLKHQTALSVAYGAGLRASEVVALKVTDVDSERMTLRIEQGKGHRDRYAMLSPVLLERLRVWWRVARAQGKMLDGGWLFPGLDPLDQLSTRQLNRAIHAAAEAANIDKRVSMHTLRHYVPFRIMSCSVLITPIFLGKWTTPDRDNLDSSTHVGKEFVVKYTIHDQVVLSREPEGPLAAHLSSFANAICAQGYNVWSLKRKVRIAACFSRWLKQRGVGVRDICFDHATQYLRYRARHFRPRNDDRAALRQLIDFLRGEGVIPPEQMATIRISAVERCVQEYEAYSRDIQALARATIINYVPFVREFLKHRFGNGRVTLSKLGAAEVVRFVQVQAPRLHLKQAKLMTTALRSFLRYMRYRGDITLDLAAAVPVVANWSRPSIPRGISADQTRELLASIDRRTAVGRRDYAILLMLARLGLRSSEVVFLELDDIDWDAGQLSVRTKGGQRIELPLPADVGKAIAAYLQHGRPKSASRRVFLRARAGITGFRGPSSLGCVVRRALQRAGIDAPTTGAHQFRYGLASQMLSHGASLTEIGEVLGHRHPQTTMIYTRVDIKALRALALPWPGGVR